ncbi:MAG: choice-of-anchor J domain-containing protein, partial [Bacteroidales bacterium]
MKRLLLFFLMAVIFAIQGWSQTTLNEGFEGTMFPPEGWTKITTQGSETWNREDSPYSNPRGVASASANRSINGHTSYLITPKLSITSNLDSISFWVRCPSNGTGTLLNILLSTTDNSVSSFNPISLLTLSNTNITPIWTRHSIALSNYIGNDIYIAFQVIDNYGMEIMLDDISGPQLFVPSCIRPTSLSVSNITTNSANISWVPANQSDSAFWLYYKENGESNFDSIHVVGSPSYSLTNLNHSTSYNVYLKTDCGSEVSQGTTIYYFSTNCGEITVFPWVENFDNTGYVGSYPPCWHRPVIFDTYPKIGYGGTGNSTKGLEIRSNFNSQTYAITPQMGEDINKLKVGFWAQASNAYNTGSLEVGIMSDPNDLSSFEIVDTIQMFQPTYREYEVSFSQTVLSGTGKYIAFRKSTLYPSEYYRIDDIVVSHITSCASPDSIYVSNISQTEADINIVPNNITDTIWRVYYRTEGTTNWTIDDVHTSQYHLTDLALNTSYEVFATTLCNDTTYSDASNVIKFRTNCNYISSLPYTQNFDTYGTNINYPLCWRKLITDYYKSNVSFSYLPPYGSLEFKAQDNNKALAICTPIYPSIPIDSLIVSFKMNYSTIDAAGIQVGIMSDPNDFSTFVPVGYPQVISQVNVWEEKSVLLSEYQGTGSYITLAAIAPEGQYARAFIDDFLIEYAPTCPNVYELEVKPASTTSVNVNFYDQADNGSGYRIAYATNINSPFNPATSTIIPIPTGTALPYIIQGFSPGDSVWVAVQRGCLGSWTNAQKTILPMFSNTLPFICDFEDATVNNTLTIYNGNQTNKWYIGANGANGTGNGLYISSDNGLTAQYSIYDSSSVMVSTLIEFDQSP